MANVKTRSGTAAEFRVIGQMLAAGFDCYKTLVDDQSIDAVIRVPRAGRLPAYFDLQIKSSYKWSNIRGSVAHLADRSNAILALFNSASGEGFWLEAAMIRELFYAEDATSWGHIFLKTDTIEYLRAKCTLEHLKRRLSV